MTNAALQGLDRMAAPVKNAAISLVIHVVALFIMLVVFKWEIYSIPISKNIFAGSICILNAHDLRGACGYMQEQKQTFVIPTIASVIMGAVLCWYIFYAYCLSERWRLLLLQLLWQ